MEQQLSKTRKYVSIRFDYVGEITKWLNENSEYTLATSNIDDKGNWWIIVYSEQQSPKQ